MPSRSRYETIPPFSKSESQGQTVIKRIVTISLLAAATLAVAADAPPKVGEAMSSEIQAWTLAPEQYSCTPEQRTKMEFEHKFCIANTDHTKEYCYGTAFMRNCTRRTPGAAG